MRYWLFKSEPGCFSIEDLATSPGRTAPWDGVRNYQARNLMRDDMKKGDLGFFYNSGAEPGIAGLVEITGEGRPDPTQFDPAQNHWDPASKEDKPRWYLVDVTLKEVFPAVLPLKRLRAMPGLEGMELLKRGSRLSVQPVEKEHFKTILAAARNQGKGKTS